MELNLYQVIGEFYIANLRLQKANEALDNQIVDLKQQIIDLKALAAPPTLSLADEA